MIIIIIMIIILIITINIMRTINNSIGQALQKGTRSCIYIGDQRTLRASCIMYIASPIAR